MTKPYQINILNSLRDCYIPSIHIFFKAASTSKLLPRFSRFINKNLYKLGLGSSLNRYDNSFTLYLSKMDKKLYEGYDNNDIFCNFGSGSFAHKRWINFDFPGLSPYYQSLQGINGVDFQAIDLCDKNIHLPFADNSVTLIYCSHTLEHLEESKAAHFIKECHRILKKGGVARLVVPSTDNDQRIMSIIHDQDTIHDEEKQRVARAIGKHILDNTVELSDKQLDILFLEAKFDPEKFYDLAVNAGISNKFSKNNPEKHITFWDYSKLNKLAKTLSFNAYIPCYRGSSTASPFTNLCVFDSTEPQRSLYSELIK